MRDSLGDVGKNASGCSPTYENINVTGIEKTWELGDYQIPLKICYEDLENTIAKYSLNTGTGGGDGLEALPEAVSHCEQVLVDTCCEQTAVGDVLGILVAEPGDTPQHLVHGTGQQRNDDIVPVGGADDFAFVGASVERILGARVLSSNEKVILAKVNRAGGLAWLNKVCASSSKESPAGRGFRVRERSS